MRPVHAVGAAAIFVAGCQSASDPSAELDARLIHIARAEAARKGIDLHEWRADVDRRGAVWSVTFPSDRRDPPTLVGYVFRIDPGTLKVERIDPRAPIE